MKVAITGLINSGKKSLFKLLTNLNNIEFENKEQITGIAKIKDKRLDNLVKLYNPKKVVPATIEFVLLKDLSLQSAQNNKILQELLNFDLICYVVRSFYNESVFHPRGDINPYKDIEFFNNELIINDLIFVEKRLERLQKDKKNKEKEKELLLKFKEHLENNLSLRTLSLTDEERELIKNYQFLTLKPILVILNIHEKDIGKNNTDNNLKDLLNSHNIQILDISVKIEEELSQFENEEEKELFLKELGINEPAINKFTQLTYSILGLISFFTVGPDEVRQWFTLKDSKAPQAARVIHSDMERGFIRAEVMKYDDLISLGSESKVKEAGKYMLKGKDYTVQDGDILTILFNV